MSAPLPARVFNLRAEIDQTLAVAATLTHSQPAEALLLATQSRQRAQAIAYRAGEARAWMQAARAAFAMPDCAEAHPACVAAAELADTLGDPLLWSEATHIAAEVRYGSGSYQEAEAHWLALLERGLAGGPALARLLGYLGMAKLYFMLIAPEPAAAMLAKAERELPDIDRLDIRFGLHINIAAHHYRCGDDDATVAELATAEALLPRLGFCEFEPELYYYRGYLLKRQGRLGEARQQFERSLSLNGSAHNYWGKVVNLVALGETCLDLAQPHAADHYLRRALDGAISLGAPYLEAQCQAALARACADIGDTHGEFAYWQRHFTLMAQLEQRDNAADRPDAIAQLGARIAALEAR
ncbi:tetratricopeptide repeat protein [Jeongeupia naejangsanensis]|uniref:Tetratricopeptide repeat protein n=1 Tax=Jeongeupia naejangsanensis TaxID=613195 RepID=A0ABS2BLQ5_9NEIS|nr:tetratricopeptide repeat protein [Jeongeupia naejangsanensis]MBM3116549.1 tetratricopeptide repeat protein [Jeongeupia naejangsanensis]